MGLGIGVWKCLQMGLLPTGTGDWLAFETRGPVREFLCSFAASVGSHCIFVGARIIIIIFVMTA